MVADVVNVDVVVADVDVVVVVVAVDGHGACWHDHVAPSIVAFIAAGFPSWCSLFPEPSFTWNNTVVVASSTNAGGGAKSSVYRTPVDARMLCRVTAAKLFSVGVSDPLCVHPQHPPAAHPK